MSQAISNAIEIRSNRENQSRAYIAGTRVRVLDVYVMAELQGLTADEIVDALPHLTLAQVHAALAHYFGNRDEIVRQLHEEEDLARQFRVLTGPGPLAEKLRGGGLRVIRFHLDESAHGRIATALRRRGIDVTVPADVQLLSASDEEQLAFAYRETRVLVTNDSDFLQLHHAGVAHARIAYCPPGKQNLGHMVRYLCLLHDCLTAEEMRGRVEYF